MMKKFFKKAICLMLIACMAVGFAPAALALDGVQISPANFPDPVFRKCAAEFDSDSNGILSEAERMAVTELTVKAPEKFAENLDGLAFFPELKTLECESNALTSLDLTGNEKLEDVYVGDNQLTEIRFPKKNHIRHLDVSMNKLEQLDLTCCKELEEITFSRSRIKNLDVHGLTALKKVYCNYGLLENLDVTGCKALTTLIVPDCRLNSLNVSGLTALKILDCQESNLTELNLDGLTALEYLVCYNCSLTNLDISGCPLLKHCDLGDNQYQVTDRTGIDYTTFPGSFDIKKVSNVVNGSFDEKNHTFSFDAEKNEATYDYDIGNGITAKFKLTIKNPFTDVHENDYFYKSVLWAFKEKIASGVKYNQFAPAKPCTRSQAVMFLWNFAGRPEPSGTDMPFTDVPKGAYFYKAVLWAMENGITSGTGKTTFSPYATCTRSQIVCFIWNESGKPAAESDEMHFRDVYKGHYAYKAILWAAEKKITSGVSKTEFGIDDFCTRGQIVCFIKNDRDYMNSLMNPIS